MTITVSTFLWVVGILITMIIALIGFIGRFVIKFNDAMNEKFEVAISEIQLELKEERKEATASNKETEHKMKEIEENYLSRFNGIYKLISDKSESLLIKINELKVDIAHLQK